MYSKNHRISQKRTGDIAFFSISHNSDKGRLAPRRAFVAFVVSFSDFFKSLLFFASRVRCIFCSLFFASSSMSFFSGVAVRMRVDPRLLPRISYVYKQLPNPLFSLICIFREVSDSQSGIAAKQTTSHPVV